jgi:plastocyanin
VKRRILALSAIAALVALGAIASGCGSAATTRSVASKAQTTSSAPKTATVIITHVTKGCHSWSVNGNTPAASQTVKLSTGGSLTVTNNDVMPHTLVQTKGPATTIATSKMSHTGAQATVSFPADGTYVFTTKAGEDYSSGIKTVGADHTLKLKVVVG